MAHTLRVVTLLGVALLVGCNKPEKAVSKPLIRPVRYLEVKKGAGARRRTFSGAVKAGTESRLSFRVAGRVLEVPVKVGAKVRPGQVIARLDPADFQLQREEARAAITRGEAQARNAKATYERVRALYANENASRQELDGARAQAESASASLASMSQNVRLLERQLEYARLTAPSAGTISQVSVEGGENVAPGQVVAVVQVGDQLEVEVAVPEALINRIEAGSEVQVKINALPNKAFTGLVTEVGVASAQAAVYPVMVRLQGDVAAVRAGMAAQVEFAFAEQAAPGAHILPPAAVGEDREGRFVFLVDRTEPGLGKVRRQPVVVGEMSSAGLSVSKGVSDGDLVVTAGVGRIRDGLVVKVPQEKAP